MKNEIIIAIVIMFIWLGCSDKKDPDNKTANKTGQTKYTLAKIEKANIEQEIKLPGQLAAYQEVSIFPKVNAYVQSVIVDVGSRVSKGEKLMILEAPEIEQAVAAAKEKYTKAKSDLRIDQDNFQRLSEASMTPGAISPMDLAAAKGKMEADSALTNAELANWKIQETMRSYLTVTAPFAGVITERNVHPGALVSAAGKDGKPMLELKDVGHLRLQVDVPEDFSSGIGKKDSVFFYINAFPGKRFSGKIQRNSMNINKQFRSERIELDVFNHEGLMAPGMYVDVLFTAKSKPNGFSVPKSSIVNSTEGKYVLVVRKGIAHRVEVITGNESNDQVEVFGTLETGELVVEHANDEIKDGTELN
jgi:RND family efflux transporter MFP subunit